MSKLEPCEFFAAWNLRECRSVAAKKTPAAHQQQALAKLHDWYGKSAVAAGGGLLVLPTGAGKTFTAIHFLCAGPLSDGYKVLWLAHTHHLLEQAFRAFDGGTLENVGEPRERLSLRVVSGTPGHFPPRSIKASDDVVLATLQTITTAHREELDSLRAFIDSANGKLFVVFDEAHHSPAPSYRKLLVALRDDGAATLGLTATPTYADEAKRGWLKKLFPQGILAQARVAELIAQGVLARPHFERAPTKVSPDFTEGDYQKWLGTYRDIPEHIVEQLARHAGRNDLIAGTYTENRERYGKTIIFTDRWFQCEAIVASLRKRGVTAGAVYSHVDTPASSVEARHKRTRNENALVLQRFRDGEIDVLVNVKMLTEGTDLPDAQTVFITRQTTSSILLTQMVGRALRGPKFGGTTDAYVVSFVDEWQQAIRWAEYDALGEGRADETELPSPKRPPLQLVSIDLVRRLTRELDVRDGGSIAMPPFKSLMPEGWLRVSFDARAADSDDIESVDQLVLVFDDEHAGFDQLAEALLKDCPPAFEREDIDFATAQPLLEALRTAYLSSVSRSPADVLVDIFHVARHIGQGHAAPQFFSFEAREEHDLDAVARDFVDRDLGPRSIHDALLAEYERPGRFWRALFPRFDQFQRALSSCVARIVDSSSGSEPRPDLSESLPMAEPDEAVKLQVKRRDHNRCLACGATRGLTVDHIHAVYRGGTHDTDNLQTLCRTCNQRKKTHTIRFAADKTGLRTAPAALASFDTPRPADAGDREHWERFIRRTFNFTLGCGAVADVRIGARGDGYYRWEVDLYRGNSPSLVAPHLENLVERIQGARQAGGKPGIQSLSISAPGSETVAWP